MYTTTSFSSVVSISKFGILVNNGGVGQITIKNNSEKEIDIDIKIKDEYRLNSSKCEVINSINKIEPRKSEQLLIKCGNLMRNEFHIVEIDYATSKTRELRRVIVRST